MKRKAPAPKPTKPLKKARIEKPKKEEKKKKFVGHPPGTTTIDKGDGKLRMVSGKNAPPELPKLGEYPGLNSPSQEDPIDTSEFESEYGGLEDQRGSSSSELESSASSGREYESSSTEEVDPNELNPVKRIRWPCQIGLISKKYGGKTRLEKVILQEHAHEFDQIFMICRSKDDKELLGYASSEKHIIRKPTEEFFSGLVSAHKTYNTTSLLVGDDVSGSGFSYGTSPAWEEIVLRGRHDGISGMWGVQIYKQMPAAMRDNLEYVFIGNNRKRAQKIIAEQMCTEEYPEEKMRQILSRIARNNRRDKKSFCFIDDEEQYLRVFDPMDPLRIIRYGDDDMEVTKPKPRAQLDVKDGKPVKSKKRGRATDVQPHEERSGPGNDNAK